MASTGFQSQLEQYAALIVRVGLNLQRGQRLLITEPYELQGVAPTADLLVAAIQRIAGCKTEVLWSTPERVRQHAAKSDWRGWARFVATQTEKIADYARNGDALLFLPGSHPGLLDGIPHAQIVELRRIGWEYFGPVAQTLMTGITNWTAAPAPSPAWAEAVFADRPGPERLAALWATLFLACRLPAADPMAAWQTHLAALKKRRDELNAQNLTALRYQGNGTDLTLALPPEHRWCTACLTTTDGIPFVANLPTEEIFTLPHRDSAEGTVRVTRPIHYAGASIEGLELTFQRGRVITATATRHANLLQDLLATDEGANRLGEVAVLAGVPAYAKIARSFHHPLLDENATPHIALGESYGFCLPRANPAAANRSLIHVDLALDAQVSFPMREPA